MEFINNLVLPPTTQHANLMLFLQIMVLLIFVPFFSLMVGGTIVSVYYNIIGRMRKNPIYLQFSKDLIDTVSVKKSAGVAFGVIPIFAITFVFAQQLYTADTMAVVYFIVTSLLLSASFILIYTYKDLFHFDYILNLQTVAGTPLSEEDKQEVSLYKSMILKIHLRTGVIGALAILAAALGFVAGFSLASDPELWPEVTTAFNVFFSWNIIARYLHFLTAAFAITGGAILFFFFRWKGLEKDTDNEYREFVKKTGTNLALGFGMFQPVFLVANLITLPETAFSMAVFGVAGVAVLLLFAAYHFLYEILRGKEARFTTAIFLLFLGVAALNVVADKLAMKNATQEHGIALLKLAAEVDAASGGEMAALDGELIYQQRCTACHSFDQKLVGPPHNSVLPKYVGKKNQLVDYIQNPKKIDPEYPPMPNPGLKPAEAAAVADYLLSKF